MLVKELMVSPVITVSEHDDLATVADVMLGNRIGCVPVVNARGEVAGVITQSDFTAREKGIPLSLVRYPQLFGQWLTKDNLQAIYEKSRTMTAREVMRSPVFSVAENDTLEKALTLILREDVNHVLVVNGKQPVGIISRFDLLKLMQRQKATGC
jgi:CBS domain-containing protein